MSGDLYDDASARVDAAGGGRLSDPAWLVTADPEQVLAALDGAAGPDEALAAAVYRASGHAHRDVSAQVRQQILAVDAARYGNPELSRSFAEVAVPRDTDDPWTVQWATGKGLDSRLRFALPVPAKVTVVAAVVVEGRGFAVAGCEDGTLHWWDLATGRKPGQAVPGYSPTGHRSVPIRCGPGGAGSALITRLLRAVRLTSSLTRCLARPPSDSPDSRLTTGGSWTTGRRTRPLSINHLRQPTWSGAPRTPRCPRLTG